MICWILKEQVECGQEQAAIQKDAAKVDVDFLRYVAKDNLAKNLKRDNKLHKNTRIIRKDCLV